MDVLQMIKTDPDNKLVKLPVLITLNFSDIFGELDSTSTCNTHQEVLYLQLDNTTKQNKGRWLMAFLALLVEAGTFRKIIVSFLPVGHTHEDIDQFFSRIGMLLRRKDAHSRQELADVISRVHASSSSWGKVRKVVHWENVANISEWLSEARVRALVTITEWNQFRIMRCYKTSQVILQARLWPGERGDYWGGLTKEDIHQRIWCGEVPNLFLEYNQVPPAQAPENAPTMDKIEKVKEGVERLLEHLKASPESRADTLKLLEVFAAPAASFSFAWDKDHIKSILGDENRNLVVNAVDDTEESGGDEQKWTFGDAGKFKICENEFYLIQPDKGDPDPFWIVKVRRKIVENGTPMVHVQYWELEASELKKPRCDRDYFKSKYGAAASNPHSMNINLLPKLAVTEGFSTPIDLLVSKSGWATIVPGRKDSNLALIRFYMELWSDDSQMHLEDDEAIPEGLMPEGRIDVPGPRIRKRPRIKSAAKPAAKKAKRAVKPAAPEPAAAKPAAKKAPASASSKH